MSHVNLFMQREGKCNIGTADRTARIMRCMTSFINHVMSVNKNNNTAHMPSSGVVRKRLDISVKTSSKGILGSFRKTNML